MSEEGKRLVAEAEKKFPTGTRCIHCGFRRACHAPANHEWVGPVDPFVVALREFVQSLSSRSADNESEKP